MRRVLGLPLIVRIGRRSVCPVRCQGQLSRGASLLHTFTGAIEHSAHAAARAVRSLRAADELPSRYETDFEEVLLPHVALSVGCGLPPGSGGYTLHVALCIHAGWVLHAAACRREVCMGARLPATNQPPCAPRDARARGVQANRLRWPALHGAGRGRHGTGPARCGGSGKAGSAPCTKRATSSTASCTRSRR